MIRPNNPAIDFEALRAKVCARADALRARQRAREDENETATQALLPYYRAADAYLDRAEDLNFPLARLPGRLQALKRFGPVPYAILRLYNYAFRKARDASTAQTEALREMTRAGVATSRRLALLEGEIARLRDLIEGRARDQS